MYIPERMKGEWSEFGWKILSHLLTCQPKYEPVSLSWYAKVLGVYESRLKMDLCGAYDSRVVDLLNEKLIPLGWPQLVLLRHDGMYYLNSMEVWVNDYDVRRSGSIIWGTRSRGRL